MKNGVFQLAGCVVFLLSAPCLALAADRVGCKDHPIISRFEGARLDECKSSQFDEFKLIVKPLTAARIDEAKKTPESTLALEGAYTRLGYEAPKDRSPVELFSNIQRAVVAAGAEVLLQCSNDACSPRNGSSMAWAAIGRESVETRYLAARFKRPPGDVFLMAIVVTGREPPARIVYEVLETKAMQTGLVSVTAAELERSLGTEGRQALYGITFDSNAATIRPESKPQIDEIVKLLKAQTQMAVYVVGHTDNVGTLDANLDLSQRRAQAVVAELVKGGVSAGRLVARGVAQLAPVASNAAGEGRARNRRVEIVLR
jgi:OmpA-OmpF porin, OOP family